MCISKQTVKIRLCLILIKDVNIMLKWVKAHILAQRTPTFRAPQKRYRNTLKLIEKKNSHKFWRYRVFQLIRCSKVLTKSLIQPFFINKMKCFPNIHHFSQPQQVLLCLLKLWSPQQSTLESINIFVRPKSIKIKNVFFYLPEQKEYSKQ